MINHEARDEKQHRVNVHRTPILDAGQCAASSVNSNGSGLDLLTTSGPGALPGLFHFFFAFANLALT